jgi:biotin operon repressor
MDDRPTERQAEFLAYHPATIDELVDALGISKSGCADHRCRLRKKGYEFEKNDGVWSLTDEPDDNPDNDTSDNDSLTNLPELDVQVEGDPDPSELTDRERYIAEQLQTGASLDELKEDIGERESVITQHLKDLKQQGWQVYIDESSETFGIEGEHTLRSSEHTGTRTRKANRWWELRHNKLVRAYRGLDTPTAELDADSGNEDWVTHLTDLHAGDEVRDEDGNIQYSTENIPQVIDYITEQSLNLKEKHGSSYDTGHLLWGGDFVTNEGIYSGQFEELDAWLDEQHEILHDPLIRQLKAFSESFDSVNVVCQVGNHGNHRANGTSKQANADLILYKSIRNTVSHLQEFDILENVNFEIGEARPYKNFELRGGKLKGHLRHGQHRRPQAETSAREKEWVKTLLEHDFDVAFMGHYHISGRIPWSGPPIICSASPKPASEFVEKISGRIDKQYKDVATCLGVTDHGITSVFPIDTRKMWV